MTMLQPICADCAVTMKCKKNNFTVRDRESGGFPSTYWRGDLFHCPKCDAEVVIGFGQPISQESATKIGVEAALTFDYQ